MAHYKVKTSHGTVEFDADRADLSQSEVEDVINENIGSTGLKDQQPFNPLGKAVGDLLTMPKRGLRGVTVGLENLISHPSQPGNALERAAEAVKPEYVAPGGEKIGSFAGAALDPVTMGLFSAGGAPFAAGGLMANIGGGALSGAGGTILDQLSSKGDFSGKQVGFDAALSGLTAGALHFPTSAIFNKMSSAVTGLGPQEMERISTDPKLMLPEKMGGAMSEGKAGEIYESALKDAGINPSELKFDKYNNKPADNKLFIKEVETDLDRKISGEKGIDISTKDLIKANRKVNDILGSLDPGSDRAEMSAWMETKNKIKDAIRNKSDKLADAFNTYSRAKAKTNLSEVIPSNSKYLMRRAALSGASGIMTGSPTRGLATFFAASPKILSAIKTAATLVPENAREPIANAVVEVLRQYRKRRMQQEGQ